MSKSQLNNLSKRQILESLMYEQNQSNATLSRLITAVARTAGIDPEKLAETFIQDKENQEYVEKFNLGVKAKHASNHPSETPSPNMINEPTDTTEPEEPKTNS